MIHAAEPTLFRLAAKEKGRWAGLQGCSRNRTIERRTMPAALKSESREPKTEGMPKPEIRE
jgi:hypothetical protein